MIDKDDSSSFRRTVLVVEDEPVNSQLLGFILSDEYNVLYAENGQQALDILNANIGRISMVLTDIKMPVMDGFTLIRSIRENADLGMIPIMVLTSETSFEETSLQLGAIDFLSKPYKMPTIIRARVRRIIELSEGRMIIKATERDLLTGLYTKEFFFEYAQRLAGASAEPGLDAVVLDVDRFHIINELYGHNSGDRVLKGIADSISAYLEKRTGICSRYEKDVFFILCEHSDDHSGLVDVVEAGMKESGVAARIGVRVGVFPCVSGEAELH
ncbi:MAG: response regulator, partial [Spirochaetales bacterium]|nr:response regulator [Spirochaetales bacterium]